MIKILKFFILPVVIGGIITGLLITVFANLSIFIGDELESIWMLGVGEYGLDPYTFQKTFFPILAYTFCLFFIHASIYTLILKTLNRINIWSVNSLGIITGLFYGFLFTETDVHDFMWYFPYVNIIGYTLILFVGSMTTWYVYKKLERSDNK